MIALIIASIAVVLIVLGILALFINGLVLRLDHNPPLPKNKGTHFAFLIPARGEEKVIEGLIQSIKEQSVKVDPKDIYVIVPDEMDKAVPIIKKEKVTLVYRQDPTLARKGYALDDGIKYLLEKGKKYDAYFIFDADNVLDKDFVKEMTLSYQQGHDIGIGYRNCKNQNTSRIAACSSLTFSMINTLGNQKRKERTNNLTLSGTGFYIQGEIIEKWKGFPFHELTEDYELTLYAVLHGFTMDYNEKAIFYDEQPTKFKTTIPQRVRWIRGFFDSRKKYLSLLRKKMFKKGKNRGSLISYWLGVKPYIFLVVGSLLLLLSFLLAIPFDLKFIKYFFIFLLLLYMIMALITLYMVQSERGKLNIKKKTLYQAVLLNPLYLLSYIPCAIKALFGKEVEWKKIEHTEKQTKK